MMASKTYRQLSDQAVWIWIGVVFVCVLGILIGIYRHEKAKPDSPHALVAAAFNQMFSAKEWRPGMGPKPFIYHPAAFNQPGNQAGGTAQANPGWGAQPLPNNPVGWNRTPLSWQHYSAAQPQPQSADGLVWQPLPQP